MLHNKLSLYEITSGAHYSVGHSGEGSNKVLAQLSDERADQLRVRMTPDEARYMAKLLIENADKSEEVGETPTQYCGRDKKVIFACDGKRTSDCLSCIPHTFTVNLHDTTGGTDDA